MHPNGHHDVGSVSILVTDGGYHIYSTPKTVAEIINHNWGSHVGDIGPGISVESPRPVPPHVRTTMVALGQHQTNLVAQSHLFPLGPHEDSGADARKHLKL